jgi:hypothetical protein
MIRTGLKLCQANSIFSGHAMKSSHWLVVILAPALGILFEAFWNKRAVVWLFYLSLAALAPFLTGYRYPSPYVGPIVTMLALGCLYHDFSTSRVEEDHRKIRVAIGTTVLIFLMWCVFEMYALFTCLFC